MSSRKRGRVLRSNLGNSECKSSSTFSGEADDAADYEVFDVDELPEEEERAQVPAENGELAMDEDKGLFEAEEEDLFGDQGDEPQPQPEGGDELDDLFGEGPASPVQDHADVTKYPRLLPWPWVPAREQVSQSSPAQVEAVHPPRTNHG